MRSKKSAISAQQAGIGAGPEPGPAPTPAATTNVASEAEYRLLVERLNVGVFHSTLDGRFVHVNQHVADLAGYTVDEWMAKPATCLYADPADRERIKAALLRDGEVRDWEVRSLRKDGTEIWLSMNARIQCDEHGAPATLIGIMSDVSARKRVEQQLRHVMKAVESTSEAIGISNADGTHVFQNASMSRLFGYATAEELQAAGGGPAVVKDPAVAGQMFANIQSGRPWNGELEMVTKDGRVFTAYEHADAIKDDAGNIIGLVGIITDITERRRAEDALRLFRESVQHSADAIGMSTPDGRHYYQNEAFDRLFGVIDERATTVYVDPSVGQRVFETIMSGDVWHGEVEMYDKDHAVLTILLRAYPIKDESGRVLGLVGLHTDITARKRAERALAESERRLAESMDQAHLAHWEMDAATRTFTFNDRFYALYATSADREGGYRMAADVYAREFLPPDEQYVVPEAVAKMLAGDLDEMNEEHNIRRRDGELRRVLVRIAVVRDAAGRVIGTRGSNQDVTELRRAEDA